MSDLHPAVTFLLAAHERAERLANASAGGRWAEAETASCDCCTVVRSETGGLVTTADLDDAPLMAAHANPTAVLLRVAEERNILAEHRPYQERLLGPLCFTCVGINTYRSGVAIHQFYPCNAVVGLAKAWGWSDCQTPGGPSAS